MDDTNSALNKTLLAASTARLADLKRRKAELLDFARRLPGYRKEMQGRPSMKRLREIESDIDASGVLEGTELDPVTQSERRTAWRRFRRWAIFALFIAGFLEYAGMPHVRTTFRYTGSQRSKTIHAGTYWSVTGNQQVRAGQYSKGCPLILLIPLETSLITHGKDAAAWGWRQIKTQWTEWRKS